jgi:glycosidase
MTNQYYPSLYQINTRVWMSKLSMELGRRATLDDIPDAELDALSAAGFDWIWLLSVWQTGAAGQKISRENEEWRREFENTLTDLREDDIAGSGFAITGYFVSAELGGDEALSRIWDRIKKRGMKLMLDFVPNHVATDHHWINSHMEFFIVKNESDLEREPKNYMRISSGNGEAVVAHGRDPFFPGWPDTLQLNYGNQSLQEAMIAELSKIARQCDGVRCDMAMLVLPDVFERTWGIKCRPFWPEATRRVREISPQFTFMAEVYWDLEWTMLQNGFDYAYDKRLYDRLKEGHARPVREHFYAGLDFQSKMARFLENHDEPRAAAEFSTGKHEAAAVITFFSPGLRFFHEGQFEGRKKRISPHLVRAPLEAVDPDLEKFYKRLIQVVNQPVFKHGTWRLLECMQAWEGNWTHEHFISFAWQNTGHEKILVAVNYSSARGQTYIRLPFLDLGDGTWVLHDLLSGVTYKRDGSDLKLKGMYVDEPGWKTYILSISKNEG